MKPYQKALIVVIVLFVLPLTSCKMITGILFRSMDNLPYGEFLASYESPERIYTINIYLCGGNATTDYSIRGELVKNSDNSQKNIYWCYHESDADVEWISEDVISINGRQLVLSENQVYDWRN